MIPFERNRQQTIPSSSLKVVGLGGAGANMLDRAALDGMEGAELLALNTDMRTLAQSVAREKLQLGPNLTKGLGAGGDPELGKQAIQEVEAEFREAVRGRKIVFLCVGLGGGTGSGAAPIVTRIAREEGAFVVVFATMPFSFEGQRRREQAETALNELAVLSNALVTFDNGRMGELVLAKQGIHEAFTAADRMISESIKAVTRLVIRPGLVNVGLDDLMTALKTNRSRCLFGSGIAKGKNRAQSALKNALSSPLLDRGSLLEDAESVLVHVSGGPDMTLYEVELLMQGLTKHVPESAHILFGAAIDEGMGESLSVTVISALPENKLTATMPSKGQVEAVEGEEDEDEDEVDPGGTFVPAISFQNVNPGEEEKAEEEEVKKNDFPLAGEEAAEPDSAVAEDSAEEEESAEDSVSGEKEEDEPVRKQREEETASAEKASSGSAEDDKEDDGDELEEEKPDPATLAKPAEKPAPKDATEVDKKSSGSEPGGGESSPKPEARKEKPVGEKSDDGEKEAEEADWKEAHKPQDLPERKPATGKPASSGQPELELDGGPRGKFEGESPNLIDGEDLDIPPYLRKRGK
ncbi:hypothetical protein [Roseibacillus ishigakijimensis]|uniref:Cell division protein FtsZ n=1 Tax=Roseibacillus ishigakijimensis TaxID=454146 RepID=A0A934VLD2_9BACT|nr:hypothetical protein [Roseibacillus ishigakijimensis]MBK1833117.1 hypothetical protein [Roseibacillus ishigakijimensis]